VLAGRRPLPEPVRGVLMAIGAVVLVLLLVALFVTEGTAVGLVGVAVALLVVIAVKVSRIAGRRP
jgi:hypothetical protein